MTIVRRVGLLLYLFVIYVVVWNIAHAVDVDMQLWERLILSVISVASGALWLLGPDE